jgi:CheY-like chemotaxis protein
MTRPFPLVLLALAKLGYQDGKQVEFVVEEDAVQTTLASLLRAAGHTVMEADSGAAGLAALAGQPVDLVLGGARRG